MTTQSETELQRDRWRRALDIFALDTINRDDFAIGGLAGRLQTSSAQLLILPADPEADPFHIDDELWRWLEEHKTHAIDGRSIQLGNQKYPTAHAAALVNGYKRDEWSNYVALYRSGAIELGLGDRGGWESKNREGQAIRVFNLISIVSYTWAMLKFGAVLTESFSLIGPWQCTVALRETKEALLGNLGEGWAEPSSYENNVGGCIDRHLLWHFQFQDWPDEQGQQQLALKVGDRIEDGWGVSQRRYLAYRGDRKGKLDVSRIAQ